MKMLISVLIFLIQNAVYAQVSTSLDVRAPSEPGYGTVKYNNPSELGKRVDVTVSDDEINGTPFWKNDWNKAYVFQTSGGITKLNQAKLNFKTSEVYFLDSGNNVKAAGDDIINKVIFIDKKDSTKKLAVFQKLNYDGNVFFQVFNQGNYQLLKAVTVSVNKKDYNTLLGKDEYAYELKPVYYFFHDGQISKIDVLNKEHLDMFIHLKVENTTWLSQNKNRQKGKRIG